MAKTKKNLNISIPDYFSESKVVSTYSSSFNKALGGGLEMGSTVQITAESGMGKSTIALSTAAQICYQGYNVVYLDTENSITKELMLGTHAMNCLKESSEHGQLILVKESRFKEVEEILDSLITTKDISFIFVDSLAGLINDGYLNVDDGISITNKNTNYDTRPLNLFCNKYNSMASTHNFGLIYLNQFRNKVDFKSSAPTIIKEFGCKNIKYNSDIILWINKPKTLKKDVLKDENGNELGINLEFEIKKSNKCIPNVKIPFYLLYGKGISDLMGIIPVLIEKGLILKSSNGYYTVLFSKDKKKLHGITELHSYLAKNYDELCSTLDPLFEESARPITVGLTGSSS